MDSGLLKDMFEGVGIVKAYLFKLHESEIRYIHLCLGFTESHKTLDAHRAEVVRQSVARLKKLFESEEKL
jgi:hypothetical protein